MLEAGIVYRVTDLVIEAGTLILGELRRPGGPRGSGYKAEVDVEIEAMLRRGLEQILNCDFVGEETGRHQTGHRYCWVVDPNDGTADFLAGRSGSAVSVGLLDEGEPVLGVIYAPATPRGPDCIAWQQGMRSLIRNGQAIEPCGVNRILQGSVVFVSSAAASKRAENDILCAPAICEPMPSIAYRLARVAAGDGAAGVSLYPVSPHDIIAGHALLKAVGGDIFAQDGSPIRYTASAEYICAVEQCFGGQVEACRTLLARPWLNLLQLRQEV
ncbi:inositol monophosphatase family protein [Stutzerimonas kunmingensis]|uniref:inositol monophosphatase family protein n=1 Tax=Stutzerimonas kunmingensis TaxID=1211807 RepID=UPI00241FEFE0|nr:inositol monophosphatase family protein [Stutzerimonas kunmingensis]